jgi:hypothetical protein
MPAGNVTLSAVFETIPAGTTPTTSSGRTSNSTVQMVGAVAVAVAVNNNDACVDTTGTIHAGGKLNMNAAATTQSVSEANGSQIPSSVGDTVGTGTGSGTPADTTGAIVTQEQQAQIEDKPIVISATVNGAISYVNE